MLIAVISDTSITKQAGTISTRRIYFDRKHDPYRIPVPFLHYLGSYAYYYG